MRDRRIRNALSTAVLCLFSTSCAPAPERPVLVKIERVTVKPPAELLTCRPEPVPNVRNHADLAAWILALADAGADCRDRLAAVKEYVEMID